MKHPSLLPLCCRQGAGALCDGSEQVGGSGLGVPDDGTRLDRGGRYWARPTAALRSPQSRLSETAEGAGHHAARGQTETKERDAGTIAHNRKYNSLVSSVSQSPVYKNILYIYFLTIASLHFFSRAALRWSQSANVTLKCLAGYFLNICKVCERCKNQFGWSQELLFNMLSLI